ncbi:MAG: hypothetical protein V4467_00440 [Patescibacteria group bacterium]
MSECVFRVAGDALDDSTRRSLLETASRMWMDSANAAEISTRNGRVTVTTRFESGKILSTEGLLFSAIVENGRAKSTCDFIVPESALNLERAFGEIVWTEREVVRERVWVPRLD